MLGGFEIPALCTAVGAVLGGLGGVIRERWKGANSKHALDLQGDQQEAQQTVALAPIWQDLLARAEARVSGLEAKLDRCLADNSALAVKYARLEEKVLQLTEQLARATAQHTTDATTITSLRTELAAARAEISVLQAKVADLTLLLHSRTDPLEAQQ